MDDASRETRADWPRCAGIGATVGVVVALGLAIGVDIVISADAELRAEAGGFLPSLLILYFVFAVFLVPLGALLGALAAFLRRRP